MLAKKVSLMTVLFAAVVSLSACGNTIRGVGADAANTVDATQSAGRNIEGAASR